MLQQGDILFCTSESWLSRTIRRVMGSPISHVAIVLNINGHNFICDSQSDGTRIRTFSEWEATYKYRWFTARSPRAREIDFTTAIMPYLNVPYGRLDLARHYIFIKTGIWLGIKREDKKLVCSEFVMRIYGVENAYKMSPNDVLKWCRDEGFIIFA